MKNLLKPRRARGKVGRLPPALRETVNQMLVEGQPYSAIIRRLAALGFPGITQHNISRWKLAGHQHWLDVQDKLDLEKLRIDRSAEAVKVLKDSSQLEDASEILLALNVYRALHEMQHRSADELLDHPQFVRLARVSTRQLAERTRRERLQLHKDCGEEELIDQLVADPQKLTRVLQKIRARCSAQPGVAANRA